MYRETVAVPHIWVAGYLSKWLCLKKALQEESIGVCECTSGRAEHGRCEVKFARGQVRKEDNNKINLH